MNPGLCRGVKLLTMQGTVFFQHYPPMAAPRCIEFSNPPKENMKASHMQDRTMLRLAMSICEQGNTKTCLIVPIPVNHSPRCSKKTS